MGHVTAVNLMHLLSSQIQSTCYKLAHDNLMWVLNPIKISAPSWWHLPINECWGDKNEFMRVIIWISTNHLITFSLFQLFSSFFLPNFDVLALFSHCHLRNHTFSLIVWMHCYYFLAQLTMREQCDLCVVSQKRTGS